LGYASTQYFTRQYKAHFATTPGEDRRRAQDDNNRKREETK
jgi:AraC-like DNA-binding protein